VRQSQIVQNAMYSHTYDAVSYITPAVPFTQSAMDFDDETYPSSVYV